MADQNRGHESGHGSHATAENATPEEARFIEEHADELSRTTQRARWIHTLDEHEDHPGQTLATQSHEVIQHWAEDRGGVPATVGSADDDKEARVLRFDFPGYGGQNLKEISWDEWFKPFDERRLVFLYQEHKSNGDQSNFFRLDSPEREHE